MFIKGAYIQAIIPEASLDDIIAQTTNTKTGIGTEGYFKPTGRFLSTNTSMDIVVSKEGFKRVDPKLVPNTINVSEEDLGIHITDNYKILGYNNFLVKSLRVKNKQKLKHKISLEDTIVTADNLKEQQDKKELFDSLFRDKQFYTKQEYVKINTGEDATRESLTRPLVLNLPTEAVIPVHVIGDPSKHLGYFVVLHLSWSKWLF